MPINEYFVDVLNHELKPALGCTDPVGVAYAAAYARVHTHGTIKSIEGAFSVNIMKNAEAVCIPGTNNGAGTRLALALGALFGDVNRELELLHDLNPAKAEQAMDFVRSGKVKVSIARDTEKKLYMCVTVRTDSDESTVVIEDDYTNVVSLQVNKKHLLCKDELRSEKVRSSDGEPINLSDIYSFASHATSGELRIIEDAVEMNRAIAEESMRGDWGLNVGKHLETVFDGSDTFSAESDQVSNMELISAALKWTVAGIDARMAGCPLPAMSNTGSGNQGIVTTLSVASVGEAYGAEKLHILRSVAVSCLVTIYIKNKLGTLSALCGGVVAACGVSCGVVFLLGANAHTMYLAIKNIFASLSGMICDGAKAGCALKMTTCVHMAMISAFLAMRDISATSTDGIVGRTEEESIDHFIRISLDGLKNMDDEIMRILLDKNEVE